MTTERAIALAVAVAAAGGSFAAFRRSQAVGSRLSDPLGLFLAVWAISLGLYGIPWIRYTHTSLRTWVAIYGSIACFVAGALAARRLVSSTPRPLAPPIDQRRLTICWLATLALGLVGFAAFLRAVSLVIPVSNVVTHPDAVRVVESASTKFNDAYGLWKLLTYLNILSFLLWTMALRLRAFHGRTRLLVPIGVVSGGVFFFTGERTLFLTTIAWAALFHLAWRRSTVRHGFLIGFAAILICLAAFLLLGERIHKGISAHPEIQAALTTHVGQSLAPLYAYASSEPPTLSRLMADPTHPHTHGALLFLPLVKASHRLHLAGVPPDGVGAFYPIPFETMNLTSWLGHFYLDYGLLGCLLVPMIFAFSATAFARLMRPSLASAALLSAALLVIVFSPVGDKLSVALTWELAIAGVCVALIIERASLRETIASGGAWARGKPRRTRLAAGLIGLVVITAGIAAVASTRGAPIDLSSRQDVLRELAMAAQRAHVSYPAGKYGSSPALASQLHASDSRLRYLGANSASDVPTQVGVVYLATSPGDLAMAIIGQDRALYQVRASNRSGDFKVTRIAREPTANLLIDSDFNHTISWLFRRGTVAAISYTRRRGRPAPPSVEVRGTPRRALRVATVTQTVAPLPSTARGAEYRLTVLASARRLSRPIPPEVKLIYTDGSYGFFLPEGQGARLKGSFGWREVSIKAQASRDLEAIEVFLVDTGAKRSLRGTQWLDHARLTLSHR